METKSLPLDRIHINGGTQTRSKLNEEVISDYLEALLDNADLPPVSVFHDGRLYWLADGFHRYWGHIGAQRKEIPCLIYQGGFREALEFGLHSNEAHGLRRSRADKNRAVQFMLSDPEWCQLSDRAIADHCHVGHHLVGEIRAKMADGQLGDLPVEPAPGGLTEDEEPMVLDGQEGALDAPRLGKDGKRRRKPKKGSSATPERSETDQKTEQETLWDSVKIRLELLGQLKPKIKEVYPKAEPRMFSALDRLLEELANHFAAWKKQLTTTTIGVR